MMRLRLLVLILIFTGVIQAQEKPDRDHGDPKLSAVWEPVPPVVAPGKTSTDPPGDAIILFNGKDFNAWKAQKGTDVLWTLQDGAMSVKPKTGGIMTKQGFGDCQLHIEWRTPAIVLGEGQDRGNSGIFLMGRYEVQVLDNYNNKTYVNGQAGSIYKQTPPLVNVCRPPGEWQTYDIIFIAPRFYDDGRVKTPGRITVIQNGVLVQNNTTIWGETENVGVPVYKKLGDKEPLSLQDHNNPTSFRNIWIREL
jgi:hypothetical protein